MHLVKPNSKYEPSFRAAFEEIADDSDRDAWIYLGPDYDDFFKIPFQEYVDRLTRFETDPPSHFVCGSTYWAVEGDEVIGKIGLRHELNDFLRRLGGHIGYIVRPSLRKRGVATAMVKKLLETERARSIGSLLLTCDEGNNASEKTIITNGGKLESIIEIGDDKPRKKRFWIHLNKEIEIKPVQEGQSLEPVRDFYQIFDYTGPITAKDHIIVANHGERIIGVVRIAEEQDLWILRGMFVHETFQRKGVGRQLLQEFASLLEQKPRRRTFLICGSHLQGFYGQIGFQLTDENEVPNFLISRRNGYREKYDPSQMILEKA